MSDPLTGHAQDFAQQAVTSTSKAKSTAAIAISGASTSAHAGLHDTPDLGLSLTPTAAATFASRAASKRTSLPASESSSRTASNDLIIRICEACKAGELDALVSLLHPEPKPDDLPDAFTLCNTPHPRTGMMPLHYAASQGHLMVLNYLLTECGSMDSLESQSGGELPIHMAAFNGHASCVRALADAGGLEAADAADHDGYTPLMNAASAGFLDIVRLLVDLGVAVDAQSKLGYTPLMNAASRGHLPIVKFLLSKQLVDPLLRNQHGETAYDVATSEPYICEVLAGYEASRWQDHHASTGDSASLISYNPLSLHVSVSCVLHENQRLDLRRTSFGASRSQFSSAALSKNDQRAPFTLAPSYDGINSSPYHLPVFRSDLVLPSAEQPFVLVLPPIALSYISQRDKQKRPLSQRARTISSSSSFSSSRPIPSRSTSLSSRLSLSSSTSSIPDSTQQQQAAASSATGERSWMWMSDWFVDLTSPRVDAADGWSYAHSFDDPAEGWTAEPPPDLLRLLEHGAPLSGSGQKFVRRRRWVRVMRRRLDRPGLPFADLDGPDVLAPPQFSTSGDEEETELKDVNAAPAGADYVARARWQAGVHPRFDRRSEVDGGSALNASGADAALNKAEARRLILRLERALSELRIGLLSDEDLDRIAGATSLMETYARRLEEVKAEASADLLSENEEEFIYPVDSAPAVDASAEQPTDYFGSTSRSTSGNRPPDLIPQLSRAVDFRVPSTDNPMRYHVSMDMPTAVSTQPKWESDAEATACRRCQATFSFLKRKHHCRRCGRVVCASCSANTDKLGSADIVHDPNADRLLTLGSGLHRTCDPCHMEIVNKVASPGSSAGIPLNSELLAAIMSPASSAPGSPSVLSTTSEMSALAECPVCGSVLSSLGNLQDQESHVKACLEDGTQTSASLSNRYLVFTLQQSPLVGEDCEICFEAFEIGQHVARLPCFCFYHKTCISAWYARGNRCPLHGR